MRPAALDEIALPRIVDAPETHAPGTQADWLHWAATELAPHTDEARTDAEVLLAGVLGLPRAALRGRRDSTLDAAAVLRLVGFVERRKLGEPVAYILGECGFWLLDLVVDTAVLIPRPDTETLVAWALQILPAASGARLLDLGTGSGAIALALGKERPLLQILATDLSQAALDVATENAGRNRIGNVTFRHGAWFAALAPGEAEFDLIVSNPPYIAESDRHLDALRYEPRLALTSGIDGLDAIRCIVAGAPSWLRSGGGLLVEHGDSQGPAVQNLLRAAGFVDVMTRRDYGGNDRVTGAFRR